MDLMQKEFILSDIQQNSLSLSKFLLLRTIDLYNFYWPLRLDYQFTSCTSLKSGVQILEILAQFFYLLILILDPVFWISG